MRNKRFDRLFLVIKCLIIIYIFFYVVTNIAFLYNAVKQVSEAEESISMNEKLQNEYEKYKYNSIYSKYENITNNWTNDLNNAIIRSKLYLIL
jgi:predicted RND superfamily exporter protein